MQNLLKHTIKIVSYSSFVLMGLVVSGLWHQADEKKGHTVARGSEELKNALFVGIAHADVPMCGAYACGSTPGGGGDGGGDCGDGGGGDDCN